MTSFSVLKEYSANKLKYFREQSNITQEELAEELTKRKLKREEELYKNKKIDKIDDTPITRQTVSKYENATIGMNQDILFDVASIFKKSINDFFPSDINIEKINKESSDEDWEESKKKILDSDDFEFDEIEKFFSKNKDKLKDVLTKDDKEMLKFIFKKRFREIDKQLDSQLENK